MAFFVAVIYENGPWGTGLMDQKNRKQLPVSDKKQEIKIKKSPTAEAMKKAPDEVIARAIHDVLLKQKEGK